LKFTKGITSSNGDSEIHLFESFQVGAFGTEAIFEVLDQADGLVALRDDSIELVLGQKAGDLVDVDADVVQGGGLASHSQSFLVQLQSRGELLFLEELIRLVFVSDESHFVKLFLDNL